MSSLGIKYHTVLADYFDNKDYFLESLEEQRARAKRLPPSPRLIKIRKVVELPWQRIQSQNWNELEKIFTDIFFIESKTEGGKVIELATEFSSAIKKIPPDRLKRRILSLLNEALRRDTHFIIRHPTTLFQCMWNSCWWYDCPQAANHYEEKDGPWSINRLKLYMILDEWQIQKETKTPGFRWLRSLRPLQLHLGTALIAILKGHENVVNSVAISKNGSRIVSGSDDGTIRIWNSETSEELKVLECYNDIKTVTISADGRRIAARSYRSIFVWDIERGLQETEIEVTALATSNDGLWIIGGIKDNTIRVWNAETLKELKVLRGHKEVVTSIAISENDHRLVSGSKDGTIRVWDIEAGSELKILEYNNSIENIAINANGSWVAFNNGLTVKFWDIESNIELNGFIGESQYNCVTVSANGQKVACGSWDGKIHIWDPNSVNIDFINYKVNCVGISEDGTQLISGSDDYTVRIWDIKNKTQL